MKRWWITILLTLSAAIVAGCGPGDSQVAQTVESQVAAALAGTAASWPTFTPAATYTPRPTYTAVPTFKPPDTATSMATLTARPSLTPYPTYTTQPSPTPVPSETVAVVISQPVENQQPAQNPSSALAFDESVVRVAKASINQMVTAMLPRRWYTGDFPKITVHREEYVDCTELISNYDRFQAWQLSRPNDGNPQVQSAYDHYEEAIKIFQVAVEGLATGCRLAAADGQNLGELPDLQQGLVLEAAGQANTLLQRAIDILAGV